MSDTFRFSVPDRPAGTPVTADEAERALRARVSGAPEGSAEHRSALWQLMRFLGFEGRHQEGQARYAEAARSFIA
jgi:hypothetical protein